MSRHSRNLPPGSVVHIVNRGNDKRFLFENALEFEEFLGLVTWAKAICPVRIVAYSIMSNHWHFVFWVEIEWDVSAFLHRLTTTPRDAMATEDWDDRRGTRVSGSLQSLIDLQRALLLQLPSIR